MQVSTLPLFSSDDWVDLGEGQEPENVFIIGQERVLANKVFSKEFDFSSFISTHTASDVEAFDQAISHYLLKDRALHLQTPILCLLENFPLVSKSLTSTATVLHEICLKSLESLYSRDIRMEGEEVLFNELKKHPILTLERRMGTLLGSCRRDMDLQNSAMFSYYDQSFQELFQEDLRDEEALLLVKEVGAFLQEESTNFPQAYDGCKRAYQLLFEHFFVRSAREGFSIFKDFPRLGYLFPISLEVDKLAIAKLDKLLSNHNFSPLFIDSITFKKRHIGWAVAQMICSTPSLKKLHFQNCHFKNSFFRKIAAQGSYQLTIREIQIDNALISDCNLKTLLKIPLQTLALHNCSQITFSDFDFEDDPYKVTMSGTEEDFQESKQDLFTGSYDIRCITIQKLSIVNCPHVHAGSIFAILNNFPRLDLSALDVRNCQGISKEELLILQEELQKKINA